MYFLASVMLQTLCKHAHAVLELLCSEVLHSSVNSNKICFRAPVTKWAVIEHPLKLKPVEL